MPKQLTLATQADGGFERHHKPARRDIFLAEMDQVVPWAALGALIEPFHPKLRANGGGRPVVGLERMLRIHFLQQWYALSDPAVEEALYDSAAMRRFVGIDLGRESAPDETTVCKFRHLLEKHGLAERVFKAVNQHLRDHGPKLSGGHAGGRHPHRRALIDKEARQGSRSANAPDQERQSVVLRHEGAHWLDARTGLVHSVAATALVDRYPAQHDQGHRGRAAAWAQGGTRTRQGVDPGGEAPVWSYQGALSRISEERRSGADVVRAGQPVDGAQAPAGHDRIGAPEGKHCRGQTRRCHVKQAADGRQKAPSAVVVRPCA